MYVLGVLIMSVPKSVIKINKNGVTYESSADKCKYYLFELSRAALRDVGKFVIRKFRDSYYAIFKRHTGSGGKSTRYNVYSNKKTIYPRVEIGLTSSGKKSKGFYSYFQEFGTIKTPKLGLLTRTVHENIPEIVKIESQYLSGLEDEAKALLMIDEEDYEGGDDG